MFGFIIDWSNYSCFMVTNVWSVMMVIPVILVVLLIGLQVFSLFKRKPKKPIKVIDENLAPWLISLGAEIYEISKDRPLQEDTAQELINTMKKMVLHDEQEQDEIDKIFEKRYKKNLEIEQHIKHLNLYKHFEDN
jgi:hypothetical protein